MPTFEEVKQNATQMFQNNDEKKDQEVQNENLLDKAGKMAQDAKEKVMGTEKEEPTEENLLDKAGKMVQDAKEKVMGVEEEPKEENLLDKAGKMAQDAKEKVMGADKEEPKEEHLLDKAGQAAQQVTDEAGKLLSKPTTTDVKKEAETSASN